MTIQDAAQDLDRCSPLTDGTALAVARGTLRLFHRHDMNGILEVPLPNGRRADIMAIDSAGRLTIVEIKCSRADLLGDMKWPDYFDYCDRYFWAVPSGFDTSLFDSEALWPARTGLIVADQYDAELVRAAPFEPLAAARRKAETLRFARRAARRLSALADPDYAAELGW
ncbi:MmcB family DNA repair protein [Sphingobium yanoikuyae]|uniref:MmcB family DNA repair protein n=1 Tax=Sphingobium yanoikuyae TaxID=13690 RepID=A0A6M4GB59_SPHYA|nr:MmcB family DNA repair protein [Sphingobium yanoikuyae]QJR04459.1 MmcB family DNA repair protein [Sphingobium yanoikuyae]